MDMAILSLLEEEAGSGGTKVLDELTAPDRVCKNEK